MFQEIRHRLLLSYLGVLATILSIFAVSVRLIFAQSLIQQLSDKLTALAQGAAANSEYENGKLKIEDDFISRDLLARHQALQWFTPQNQLIYQTGNNIIKLPLSVKEPIQIQKQGKRIIAVTLPILENEERQLIGYVRASQSLEEYDETLRKLDFGLGSGILTALILSSLGGIWLTRQAMQPIEESFARLKQFTADASHELRSPLMAIKTNTMVALKYSEGMRENDREKFEAIASATSQMTRLTEDLLFLARTDQMPEINWECLNLTNILKELIQIYTPHAKSKNIKLQEKISENLLITGDANQIKRLFTNLIDNAIHYTLPDGEIQIIANSIDEQVYIQVKDTGIGMTSEDLKKVFERFWRADQARSYDQQKTGLGLAIVQAIAQNHQGSISVSSQLGKGSIFTVYLPKSAENNC
ncbi:two-component sensor histidine kinase [Aphanothece hegewaldii CCALA 016]|uniref:histidine kinase n=1 Tax=Aphanothece hegewaldii CCALA 016 TaxID=2107694 RepID=A0A2T1LSR3_9CHRO|nr:HAMP domain-containing histidine kinase [Aphanothece hegewaldii]PSF32931.1 two-component sensor histidine kinase [Aphanothece hegewaldii CCALA 016]